MSRIASEPRARRRASLPMRRRIKYSEFEALLESGVFAPDAVLAVSQLLP